MGKRKAKKQAEGCVTMVLGGFAIIILLAVVGTFIAVIDSLSKPGVMDTIMWGLLWILLAAGAIFGLVKWAQHALKKQPDKGTWTRFRSEIRGIFVDNRRRECGNLRVDDKLVPVRDSSNPQDVNAIALTFRGEMLGYLPREQVDEIAPVVDAGGRFHVRVMQIDRASTGAVSDVILLCELEGEHRVSPLTTRQERKRYATA